MPSAAALFRRLLQQRALEHKWAPEEDTSLPEDAMVDLLAMLEEDEHQLRAKVVSSDARPAWAASAVAADDEAVMSKFAARVGSMASIRRSQVVFFLVSCLVWVRPQ